MRYDVCNIQQNIGYSIMPKGLLQLRSNHTSTHTQTHMQVMRGECDRCYFSLSIDSVTVVLRFSSFLFTSPTLLNVWYSAFSCGFWNITRLLVFFFSIHLESVYAWNAMMWESDFKPIRSILNVASLCLHYTPWPTFHCIHLIF